MQKILVLFAHPRFEQSKSNKALIEGIKGIEGVTLHDLYEQYHDFNVDTILEQNLLVNHDVIIWHHPFYWYSCPPLLKQWIDIVLEYGWAYGPGGNALEGKKALNVLTAGGTRAVYCSEGRNNYTINEFLRPFEQTARLCGMDYLPPFTVLGTHQLTEEDLHSHVEQYQHLIERLKEGDLSVESSECLYLNDLPELKNMASS